MIKALVFAAAAAAALFVGAPGYAAPLGSSKVATAPSQTQLVHWRGYRHCHRWGCHGPRRYRRYRSYDYGYNDYGYRPGIYLRFGGGHRHHHRRHWR